MAEAPKVSLYSVFSTEGSLEQAGVWIDVGSSKFKLARAGGDNTKFKKASMETFKPFEFAIATDALDEKTAHGLVVEVFVGTVLLDWQEVYDPELKLIPYSRENAIKLLTDLPALFVHLMAESQKLKNFRKKGVEETAKN